MTSARPRRRLRSVVRGGAERLETHPVLRLAVALLGMAAAVTVLLTYFSLKPDGNTASSDAGSAASSSPTASGSGAPGSEQPTPVGTCLDAERTKQACNVAHAYEVYATPELSQCSRTALLSFLGGSDEVDVTAPSLKSELLNVGPTAVCALSFAAGLDASARDALRSSRGDVFRKCWDAATGMTVSCSQPHEGEAVATRLASGDQALSCERRASEYMGTPLTGDLSRALTVRLISSPEPECRIEVLGENVLTASLRRLGTRAAPIESSP